MKSDYRKAWSDFDGAYGKSGGYYAKSGCSYGKTVAPYGKAEEDLLFSPIEIVLRWTIRKEPKSY